MELLGLSPLALSLTLAGLTVVVLALYLLKNEQRKVIVPSVIVWDTLLAKRRGVTWARKLRRLFSMLLALLITALLALSISDPRKSRHASDRRLIILIDASASMQASDVSPSRLEAAKQLASKLVRSLGGSDRALIAQLDASVTPLSTLTADRAALLEAIGDISVTDLAGDLEVGAAFAANVLERSEHAELYVLSDGNLRGVEQAKQRLSGIGSLKVHYLRVGESRRNVGIEHFSVRRYPLDKTHTESIVRVRNFGHAEETATLRILAGQTLLYEEKLALPAGNTVKRTFSNLVATGAALEAHISLVGGSDALAVDDRAYAALPARKRSRVLVVSEGNRYLEAALLLDEYLDVDERSPDNFTSCTGHDVVIFDQALPSEACSTPALYLAPAPREGGAAPIKSNGKVERPFFERVDDDHPLTRKLALRDINVSEALVLLPEHGDRVLAQTAKGIPLLVEGERQGTRFISLAFDMRKSDLPLRASFPLFILGAIDRLAGEQPSHATPATVGETWRVQVPAGLTAATLTHGDGAPVRVAVREREAHLQVAHAGIYRLDAGPLHALLAANVPAEQEGAIAPQSSLIVKPSRAPEATPAGFFGALLWPMLAALAALLLCFEWLGFHRRWTV